MANYPNLHVFALGDEALVAWENPHRHWENTQTLHRKALGNGFKSRTFLLGGNYGNHRITVLHSFYNAKHVDLTPTIYIFVNYIQNNCEMVAKLLITISD